MRLFYFTESFPYGLGESWKKNEIDYLSTVFDEIIIVPLWDGNNPHGLNIEKKNVLVLKPALEGCSFHFKFRDFTLLFNYKILLEIIWEGAWRRKRNLIKVLLFYKRVKYLKKSEAYKYIKLGSDSFTIWYFFWGRGWADILPFCKIKKCFKIAVRLHGYDLYKERNAGYIPFRKNLLNEVNVILPVSDFGKAYIVNEYKVDSKKVIVSRLGTTFKGLANSSSDNILRIVSCSSIVQVKRLDRIINAFKKIQNIEIEWTHIGDGPLKETMEAEIKILPRNILVKFIGQLSPKEVENYYLTNTIDLFINSSESEGVPISIMEAFSFGIPVIASNVGGTSEIVDSTVGFLISNVCFEEEFVKAINYYFFLSVEEKNNYRKFANIRFRERCDAFILGKQLFTNLIK